MKLNYKTACVINWLEIENDGDKIIYKSKYWKYWKVAFTVYFNYRASIQIHKFPVTPATQQRSVILWSIHPVGLFCTVTAPKISKYM